MADKTAETAGAKDDLQTVQGRRGRRSSAQSSRTSVKKLRRQLSECVAAKTLQLSESAHQVAAKTSQQVAARTAQLSESAHQVASNASQQMAAKRAQLQNSIFGHMVTDDAIASAAMARRRAMMLVDVLVERHTEGALKFRWILLSALITFCYLRYLLPVSISWGTRYWERSVGESEFENTVGGAYSRVSFGAVWLWTLSYFILVYGASRLMETRMPVRRMIFETLVVYNLTQMLLNFFVFVNLLWEAKAQGFQYPWGNQFTYTKESHRLGYYIYLHYHCCQLELLDTMFVVIRKKFQKITFLHVWLRLLNMWAWFFACRFACGGDTYFPAAVNAGTRAVVYAFYSLSLLTRQGTLIGKARVTGVQMLQFGMCGAHALFCLVHFWDMDISRWLLAVYLLVMLNGLVLFSDFHYQVKDKSKARVVAERKVSFAFDSSGWLYCYHFGVAHWLREHLLPEGLSPENCAEEYPDNCIFSGCSGGALAAAVLCLGLEPKTIFESVLSKRHECRYNPFAMLPAVEDVVSKMLPSNACSLLTDRLRVLLTRVSLKYPFFSAEVVNTFQNNETVFHTLRATCHVPIIGGLLPYRFDGHCYLDGMFWPQMMVPWRGSRNDHLVRISTVSLLSGDIMTSYLPTWWSIFPPEEDILRGLFWLGYADMQKWFTQPPSSGFECWSCRRSPSASDAYLAGENYEPSHGRRRSSTLSEKPALSRQVSPALSTGSQVSAASEAEEEHDQRMATWLAARKLLLCEPSDKMLPDICPTTGRNPNEFLDICNAAMARDQKRLAAVLTMISLPVIAWIVGGCF